MRRTAIPVALRRLVSADAGHRCGYCQSDEALTGVPLSVEHILPLAAGGQTTRDNLWRSCRPCNELKGPQVAALDPESGMRVPLFNPRVQPWFEHFAWSDDGTLVIGLTPIGRATVLALQLNRSLLVSARRR